MGARTSNRKRDDECLSLNRSYSSLRSPDFHVSKKPKFSTMSSDRPVVSSNSTVARLSRYPEETSQLRREVHGPCRLFKFGLSRSFHRFWESKNSELSEQDEVGNILSHNYQIAKSRAIGSLRSFPKDVIELDSDSQTERNASGDSKSEDDVEVVEDDKQDQRPREVDTVEELDEKVMNVHQPSSSLVIVDLTNDNSKVENAEKMLGALSLDRDLSSVSAYKKLLQSVEKRTSRLKSLDFEIELNEKRRSILQSLTPKKKPLDVIPRELFTPLTKEEEAEVEQALSSNRRRVLVAHENSNIEITGETFQCLRPAAWLNDEVINLYLELLKERERREPEKYLKCHFFNTFFYKKLNGRNGYDYRSVRRWTSQRKLKYELIDCDKIFVPIHREIHWCLAVINKKEKKFQYLDSLKGMDSHVLKTLARYFVDEVKDKSGKDIDVSSWAQEFVEDLPEQENGFDCGMFMIKYADFYSRGLNLCFKQEHMPYFRLRTAKEILKLRAN
ncbi:ubiquitin-like-specific protease ESD4 isoform X1 [Benincasa hispida]|uniref:ubiquitin-like-specific protease ESD4 isoform X1 n=1 Tax=Benincasa hispida TaxID=102211 RepID=UPI001901B506|nr:ubiquitin-like-specific protease ESD4 isoform X1 [Benincasa hispida]